MYAAMQSQSVPKMRSVLCGAVVLCLLQCCTAVPLEEFVGYPFSNETHRVYHIPTYYYYYYYRYHFPVNISQIFVIDGSGLTRLEVSHFLAARLELMLIMSYSDAHIWQCPHTNSYSYYYSPNALLRISGWSWSDIYTVYTMHIFNRSLCRCSFVRSDI